MNPFAALRGWLRRERPEGPEFSARLSALIQGEVVTLRAAALERSLAGSRDGSRTPATAAGADASKH